MKFQTRTVIIVAAMAGLMTGCASPAPKECKRCVLGGKSDKVSCGTKSACSSKSSCRANGNCGTKTGS